MKLSEEVVVQMLDAALSKGRDLGIMISAAIVDGGGHLLGFRRHDNAEIVSIRLAQDKAYTALVNRLATDKLGELCRPGAELYGLQYNLDGRMVIFGGGVPIWEESHHLIGAIGVSGGSTAEDMECAEYAITAAFGQQT
jgi:uncharacterized protein GlcG (DUF336 family)